MNGYYEKHSIREYSKWLKEGRSLFFKKGAFITLMVSKFIFGLILTIIIFTFFLFFDLNNDYIINDVLRIPSLKNSILSIIVVILISFLLAGMYTIVDKVSCDQNVGIGSLFSAFNNKNSISLIPFSICFYILGDIVSIVLVALAKVVPLFTAPVVTSPLVVSLLNLAIHCGIVLVALFVLCTVLFFSVHLIHFGKCTGSVQTLKLAFGGIIANIFPLFIFFITLGFYLIIGVVSFLGSFIAFPIIICSLHVASQKIYKSKEDSKNNVSEFDINFKNFFFQYEIDGETHQEKVRKKSFIVGRSDHCDIKIDFEIVSRKHMQVFFEDGVVKIMDLGSTNGIFLNGRKLKPHNKCKYLTGSELFIKNSTGLRCNLQVLKKSNPLKGFKKI